MVGTDILVQKRESTGARRGRPALSGLSSPAEGTCRSAARYCASRIRGGFRAVRQGCPHAPAGAHLRQWTAMRLFKLASCAGLLVLAVLYGVAIQKYRLPPYRLVEAVVGRVTPDPRPAPGHPVPPEHAKTDVAALIRLRNQQDVRELRRKVIERLWGRPQLPSGAPSAVLDAFVDRRFVDIAPLRSISRITISMEFGLQSHAYHFLPKAPRNGLVVYHEGHLGDFSLSKDQIRLLLGEGYAVAALCMPLVGLNNQPTVELPRHGFLKLTLHDQLKFLAPQSGHPVKFFVEPVVVLLNYLAAAFGYRSVGMVGISGGGWTTTVAAAIDERIARSFPVAGSYPIHLRSSSPRDWGDYEQTVPELYDTANYLELYVLGASGPGRKQLQVINEFDACCFAGTRFESYRSVVADRVRSLGAGEFDVFLDDTHRQHLASAVAMRRVLEELRRQE
jgi:hypothetical protein